MEHSSAQGGDGAYSTGGAVDEVWVSGEAKESVEGFVNRGNGVEAEMETVDRERDVEVADAATLPIIEVKEHMIGGGTAEVDGAKLLETTVTIDVSAAETLMEHSSTQGGDGTYSTGGAVDEVWVSGEAKESVEGFVNRGNGVEAEMETEDRGCDMGVADAAMLPIVGISEGKEHVIGGGAEVEGAKLLEATVMIDISAAETLMENLSAQGGEDAYSTGGAVDEVWVSGEANESVEGFVNRGNGVEADMDSGDRGRDVEAPDLAILPIVEISEGKEHVIGGGTAVNDGVIDTVLKDEVSRLGFKVDKNYRTTLVEPSVDGHVQSNFMTYDKEEKVVLGEVSQCTGDGSNTISLVVDLNSRLVAGGERKSANRIDNKGIEVKELSGDLGISFSDGLADNAACHINEVDLNGNQGAVIKEQVSDIEQPEYVDQKKVKQAALEPEFYGREHRIEKEGEFFVSDLVWGKVKSHPWWPGQIFDPSASSEKAMKHFRKDCFIIAYFGDQTFAWNDASRIKPFRMHFSHMDKQSNSESFCRAVNCALDEVSRRVEFGLACSCLLEEDYAKIKSQVIVNAGIKEESSRRDGGDNFSGAASFIPAKLVLYLKTLAQAPPLRGTGRLEFVAARAQLMAFNRWKGYYQLPALELLNGLLKNDADVPVLAKEKDPDEAIEDSVLSAKGYEQVSSGKGKSIIQDSSSRKRKHISGDGVFLSKKERCMSDLMSESCLTSPNGENKSVDKAGRKITSSSSGKKRKAVDFISNDSRVKSRKSGLSPGTSNKMSSPTKKLLRVGERICRVASQLSGSTPILKYGDKTSKNTIGKNGRKLTRAFHEISLRSSEKTQNVKVIPAVYPPVDEMLSQLCLAARAPMKGYRFLNAVVSFFCDFRNSFCPENSNSQKDKGSTGKVSIKQTGNNSSNSETTETSGFEGIEDSYWPDRIIQSNPEEQVLFEPETPVVKGMPTVEPKAALDSSAKLDYQPETAVMNLEPEAEKPAGHLDEKGAEYSPTALVLNFMDLNSVPSETNLIQIFSRYGPLNESETEVLKKSNRAKVVFKRRSDAETAFSSAGKFSTFGPSLVSYRLNYSPTPCKASTPATTRNRKDATSVKGNAVRRLMQLG